MRFPRGDVDTGLCRLMVNGSQVEVGFVVGWAEVADAAGSLPSADGLTWPVAVWSGLMG
jgi:hypothetical protein